MSKVSGYAKLVEISIVTIIFLILISLKLTNCISWPWLWVMSPLWGVYLLGLSLYVVVGFLWALKKAYELFTR